MFEMRVPTRYAQVEKKTHIRKSTHTEIRDLALKKETELIRLHLARWDALLAGRNQDAVGYQKELVRICAASGFDYAPAQVLSEGTLVDLLARINAVDQNDPVEADALLGGAEAAALPFSTLFDHYEAINKADIMSKSAIQLKKWAQIPKMAVANFVAQVGDLDLTKMRRSDVMQYRKWLSGKIEAGELVPYSANRELYTLSKMVKDVSSHTFGEEIDLFSKIGFIEVKTKKRNRQVSFSPDWIRGKILAPGALDRLNADARDLIIAMINTGARPSELVALNGSTIVLSAPIPYISIEADGRELKSVYSERKIPLVGVSLEAMARHPNGFERYPRATAASGLIAKYLKNNDLLETDDHRLYCLRHSWRDALRNAGCADSIAEELMGHAPEGIDYGDGVSMDVALEWIRHIAY